VASIIAGPSVAELAGQILEQIEATGEVTPTPEPVDRLAIDSDANTLNVDLTHMSDEDIDRFLSEMLAASENES
jgi:hypothetical protein